MMPDGSASRACALFLFGSIVLVCTKLQTVCDSGCDDDADGGDVDDDDGDDDDQVKEKGYAVVVVAEGAGEELVGQTGETDATG